VFSGREALKNDRVSAGVFPTPRRVIDRHMGVSDSWRHWGRARPEYRLDVQIPRAIANEHNAPGQRFRKGRIDDNLGWSFILRRLGRRPRLAASG
jgi:hypothetical protein